MSPSAGCSKGYKLNQHFIKKIPNSYSFLLSVRNTHSYIGVHLKAKETEKL